ncbi:MAG: CoA-binding protein [Gemmatimonadota bacterium]|nr:CoA-binding protein [Gemmatimonadota bacterium]
MTLDEAIDAFLETGPYAVVGASRDRAKYGNKVLRCYLQHGLKAYAINPGAAEIEGRSAYPDLAALPEPVERISVITPPRVTEGIVTEAADAGVRFIWMQPGAESPKAVEDARDAGIAVVSGGPCLLVVLGYTERD